MGVIYRNYNDPKRETELIKIAKACKKKRYQLFVSNDIKLALKVRADGIYIPSFNKIPKSDAIFLTLFWCIEFVLNGTIFGGSEFSLNV